MSSSVWPIGSDHWLIFTRDHYILGEVRLSLPVPYWRRLALRLTFFRTGQVYTHAVLELP